jgi:hypothetical protein
MLVVETIGRIRRERIGPVIRTLARASPPEQRINVMQRLNEGG